MEAKNIPSYFQITNISTFKNAINAATEVSYDMTTKELIFWVCEAPAVVCTFDPNVIGSEKQLSKYFISYLRKEFPEKRKTIKINCTSTFELIRSI